MERTQISLDDGQLAALRERARERGVSIAALVREAVDALLRGEERGDDATRSLAAVGRYASQPDDVAREHDRFLDAAYRT